MIVCLCRIVCLCISGCVSLGVYLCLCLGQEIRDDLLVEKRVLSATVRRGTSAQDRRPSAQTVGWLGVLLLVVPALLVLGPDVVSVLRALGGLVRALRGRGGSLVTVPRHAGPDHSSI